MHNYPQVVYRRQPLHDCGKRGRNQKFKPVEYQVMKIKSDSFDLQYINEKQQSQIFDKEKAQQIANELKGQKLIIQM